MQPKSADRSSGGLGSRRLVDHAYTVLKVLLTVMFTGVVVAAIVQVFARYVLQTSVAGSEEVARYLMVACTFLAIPVLARSRNQIAVDALAHYLPKGMTQVWLARLILLVELTFLVIFSYYTISFVQELAGTGQASVSLQIPLFWVVFTMAAGAVLGIFTTLLLIIDTFIRPDPRNPYGLTTVEHGQPQG